MDIYPTDSVFEESPQEIGHTTNSLSYENNVQ
jgi:hypothetical protein